ncbi:MAG: glycosyltransferase family 9 protein [Phycisphaeraceae bacterium]|nr:MAG: glycosyltransferase family 9 protein [Phycisphaeraceae bacterium]
MSGADPVTDYAAHDSADSPRRLLIVLPSWVGDAVMATPTLRILRERLPGAFIGALARPGVDEVLAGTDFFDEIHVAPRSGMMGVKLAAARVRTRRYDTALLLTNSFSSALVARMAWIRRRVGYERDARTVLLSKKLRPPIRRDTPPYSRSSTNPRDWAPIPACEYYLRLARLLLDDPSITPGPLELVTTPEEEAAANAILSRAGLDGDTPDAVILNPGGNNPAKRWPAARFAEIGARLIDRAGVNILVSGAPAELELTQEITRLICDRVRRDGARAAALPELGLSLGALKSITRRCRLMLTNDTGPRHIAAAFEVPVVTLFGPTDHRWTTIPFEHEAIILADPRLPEEEVANDHPERCAIDNITVERVWDDVGRMMGVE